MRPTKQTKPVILLTGQPGIGKSTIIRKVVSLLGGKAGGFYTREVRTGGKRTGFQIVTVDGHSDYLASKDLNIIFAKEAPFKGYRINLEAIETIVVPSLYRALEQGQIVIIDEIGPMEFISARFRQVVVDILASEAVVAGSIVQRPNAFADQVKAHHRVEIRQVTIDNRDEIATRIHAQLIEYLAKDRA